ncbi:hypothetical protein KQI84_13570 [bacterium]|nr:hypothetical protein [bacterium]
MSERCLRFRSSKFPACEDREETINPNRWGRRLAEHLAAEIDVQKLWVCCGNADGEDDGFVCSVAPRFSARGLFRKQARADAAARVLETIQEILAADPDVHDICLEEE